MNFMGNTTTRKNEKRRPQADGASLTGRNQGIDMEADMKTKLTPKRNFISGRVPDGVSLARPPGLGARQIVVRHRRTRSDPGPATRAVLDALLIRAAALELG